MGGKAHTLWRASAVCPTAGGYSPNFPHNASTRAFVAPSISIIAGHGLSNPSAFHFRVASIPIFDP